VYVGGYVGGDGYLPRLTLKNRKIRKMKNELQKELGRVSPSLEIVTIWEHDTDLFDIRDDCEGFDDEQPGDWQAWQSEVKVSVIVGGVSYSGSAFLGGTWERASDHPSESNPDISGYYPGMVREALSELASKVDHPEILDALEYLDCVPA
jgi:hypothetical protein